MLTWYRLQEYVVYSRWFSLHYESQFHFCDGGHRVFPQVGVTMNLSRFDVLLGNKLSIIRLYLFCCLFAIFFLSRSKDDENEQQFSQIFPYYQERKVQQVEASISKIKYRGTRKSDMGKPFAFFPFQDLDLVVSQIGNEVEDGGM